MTDLKSLPGFDVLNWVIECLGESQRYYATDNHDAEQLKELFEAIEAQGKSELTDDNRSESI